MSTSIPITNPSATHALRISVAHAVTDERSRVTGWGEPRAVAVLQPLATENVLMHHTRRVSLELLGGEEAALEITNKGTSPGQHITHTLRVLAADAPKGSGKFSEPAHVAFVPPGQSIGVPTSARRRVVLQQQPA